MDIKHTSQPLSIKSIEEDGLFVGYASVFNVRDSQKEIVVSGAFQKSLDAFYRNGGAPAMLWMHDPTKPIGLWVAMKEDENGLVVQGRLALQTQKGKEAYELLKMKALTGLSIGYRVISSKIDARRKARILTEVDLFEVSLVTFPANDAARVSQVKSPESKRKKAVDKEATKKVVSRLKTVARKLTEKKVK